MVAELVREYADRKAKTITLVRPMRKAERPSNWRDWIAANFNGYLWPPYASYHVEFWDWAWSIQAGQSQPSFIAIWPRGFAKSTSTEVACALMAGEGKRNYGLYVCSTQDRADDHVKNVAGLLGSQAFSRHYPGASQRKLSKYGASEGWRRNRLRTESGFTLDAIGLDSAARGAKIDEDRPDFIIFDDIDGVLDSPGTTQKKITTITQSILPARAAHAVVLVAQNLIHENGVVARLADGRADFLANRIISGPHPAINDLAVELVDGKQIIVGGEPTWPAMDIPKLQAELDDIGLTAFLREKQHDVTNVEGGIFSHVTFEHCAWDDVPWSRVNRTVVWVDPAVTDNDGSDAHGVQADALVASPKDGTIYRLFSWEQRASPEQAIRVAILKAVELKAESVGVETDQGGDTWKSVYKAAWDALVADGSIPRGTMRPRFKQEKAGAGHGPKAHRASLMLADYERGGRIVHVLDSPDHRTNRETLEKALRRYLIIKPFDLVDGAFWSWHDLRSPRGGVVAT